MTIIHLLVESSFTGPGGGFQRISIDDSFSAKELIRQYCVSKGIDVSPNFTIIARGNTTLEGNKPLSHYGVKDNDNLVLSSLENHSKTYRFGHWFTLAGLGFLFGLLGMTICIILFAVIRTIPDNYAIVIDAGSTHSDVILYKWPGLKVNNTGEVEQVSTCYIKGGIAQVTPTNVSSYFDPCFSTAESQIPQESIQTAEVLFGATAGMRLLNTSDSSKTKSIEDSVKRYLKTTHLVMRESNVNIISGIKEGMSGWITINFLKDTIYSKLGRLNASFGALDMGGASTQITFEVPKSKANDNYVTNLHLFGHEFKVYSKSFLCYGVVQALIRYRAILLEDRLKFGQIEDVVNVTSPCEPAGRILTLHSADFDTPCLKSPKNFLSLSSATTFNFVGTSDFEECSKGVSNLLDLSTCERFGWMKCMDPSVIPADTSERQFMGFASYAYVANALLVNESTTKEQYEQNIRNICSMSRNQLMDLKSSQKKNPFLKDLELLCFKSQFVFKFLSNIYGFNTEEKWRNLKFTTMINGTSLGWSLGYMINATEEIAAGTSVPTLETVPFALLLVLFAMFLLISIGFVFHGIKLRKTASYHSSSQVSVPI